MKLSILFFTATTLASPVPPQQSTPVLPPSSLPTPTSPPKQILLGFGHQNYTCDSPSTATATGATAALFDIRNLLSRSPHHLAAYLPGSILSISGLTRDTIAKSSATSAAQDPKDFRLAVPQLGVTPVGYHYFNSDKLPVFTLPSLEISITARKQAGVAAPGGAMRGPDGQDAVDWLFLSESGQGRRYGGISSVYRVYTAGGSGAGVCAGVGVGSVVRVPYAAEYWMYG